MKSGVCMLMLTFSGCAHSIDSEMPVGSWMPVETVECPDILVIHKNGKYTVYNDCYSVTPNCPIVVEGVWVGSGHRTIMERRIVNRGGVGPFAEVPLLTMEISNDYIWMLDQQGKRIEKFKRAHEVLGSVTC